MADLIAAGDVNDKNVEKELANILKVDEDRILGPREVWEKYLCPCCKCLLFDAVQCACGHRLCRGCAEYMFKR